MSHECVNQNLCLLLSHNPRVLHIGKVEFTAKKKLGIQTALDETANTEKGSKNSTGHSH